MTPSPSVTKGLGPIRTDNAGRVSGRNAVGMRLRQGILADHPELKLHPIVQHSLLNTRDALYGCRTEAMRLHHAAGDGETIQYIDVMSLYPTYASILSSL